MAKRKSTRRSKSSARRGSDRKSGGNAKDRPKKVGARRLPARTSSAREAKRDQELVRLNKFLADCGVASRRGCDELIEAGKVLLDGMPVTALGTKVDPATQEIEVDGKVLRTNDAARRYYVLNKPSGVVCTNEKRETRPRAIDLITDRDKGRIYSVGRLDEDSTGLLLLTNDGEFAQKIAHPRFGVPKTYRVRVTGRIPDEALQKVREGIHLSEGKTAGARILVRRRTAKSTTLSVTLREGKNREVRRVFARVGFKVVSLERTDIGPLTTRGLKAGKWRALSRDEVEALLRLADGLEEDTSKAPQAAPRSQATRPGVRRKKAGASAKAGKKKVAAKKPAARRKPARKKPEAEAPKRRRIVGPQ